MTLSSVASMPIAGLDLVRRRTFRAALGVPALRRILVDKDRRISVQSLVGVAIATLVATASPRVALVASPLLLGVPHLASEVRWLVLRRALPRSQVIASIAFAMALAIVAAFSWSRGESAWLGRIEVALGGAWIFTSAALATDRPRAWLVGLASAALIAGGLASGAFAVVARDVAVGLHALVSIAIWALAFRSRRRFALPAVVAAVFGLAVVVLLRGSLVAQAFLQSIHYAVWLVLVPQEGVRARGSPTFSMSAKGWWRDLGVLGVAAVMAAFAGIGLLSLAFGSEITRDMYLVVARFHVWFELAMGASLLGRRERIGLR